MATAYDGTAGVYFMDQNLGVRQDGSVSEAFQAKKKFREFLRSFGGRVGEQGYKYLTALTQQCTSRRYHLDVSLDDLIDFNADLAQNLIDKPNDFLPIFEEAAKEVALSLKISLSHEEIPYIQICLSWTASTISIRSLDSRNVTQLVKMSGIVINASRMRAKAMHIVAQCTSCKAIKEIPVRPGLGGFQMPRKCDRVAAANEQPCPLDPFAIVADKCTAVDQQLLKVQEFPELVPTGEMPRHVLLACDRYLVEKCPPGTRITVVGIFSIFSAAKGVGPQSLRNPYVRVVGLADADPSDSLSGLTSLAHAKAASSVAPPESVAAGLAGPAGSLLAHSSSEAGASAAAASKEAASATSSSSVGREMSKFSAHEEAEFAAMARDPELYNRIARSMNPAIHGCEDIKKAITCQLFGGSRKEFEDGMKLRGDINVLLLGDPSTAKSQLLKFTEKVAPIGVYTSGKGSSAAGLTASVIREASGEFYLEGGSMVLASGGIVCIDEFDKMREEDRVAIHEAMEQQTISIAKAGITTVLNSRTSVLAAANPIFGRYLEDRSAAEQIDFQSTILSRFDLLFIVRDTREEERDMIIADHVLSVHMGQKIAEKEAEIPPSVLRRYIAFARSRCKPRIDEKAAEDLKNFYVNTRAQVLSQNSRDAFTIPVTVRQLEAIIRITESLAKISLSPIASSLHVQEAIRLFKLSTLDAINTGSIAVEGSMTEDALQEVHRAEEAIKGRVPIGAQYPERKLLDDFVGRGYSEDILRRAVMIMVRRNELEYRNQRKNIFRRR